jgi:hypothetical protein
MDALTELTADSAKLRIVLDKRKVSLAVILKRKYSKGDKREARAELGLISGKIELLNWLDGRIRQLSIKKYYKNKEKETWIPKTDQKPTASPTSSR